MELNNKESSDSVRAKPRVVARIDTAHVSRWLTCPQSALYDLRRPEPILENEAISVGDVVDVLVRDTVTGRRSKEYPNIVFDSITPNRIEMQRQVMAMADEVLSLFSSVGWEIVETNKSNVLSIPFPDDPSSVIELAGAIDVILKDSDSQSIWMLGVCTGLQKPGNGMLKAAANVALANWHSEVTPSIYYVAGYVHVGRARHFNIGKAKYCVSPARDLDDDGRIALINALGFATESVASHFNPSHENCEGCRYATCYMKSEEDYDVWPLQSNDEDDIFAGL